MCSAPADLHHAFPAEKLCAKHGFLRETPAKVPTVYKILSGKGISYDGLAFLFYIVKIRR